MRCAIYIRVSKNVQEQKQSLQNQKELLTDIVKNNGWEISDFYVDIKTATKEGRKDFNRLLEDVKSKKFDIIISKELSRLARNELIAMELKRLTENNAIKIYTLDGASNLEESTDMFGFYAWHYAKESRDISRRIKTAFRSKNKRGERTGSNAPYGYKIGINGKLEIKNDSTVEIVKRIFKSYINGKSYDQIARELTKECIPTPSQTSGRINSTAIWHGSTIRLILSNQTYTGNTVGHKVETISANTYKRRNIPIDEQIIIEDTHEPIINKSDLNIIQTMLENRTRNKGVKPKPNSHLFSGLLYCNECGKGMHFKANRKGYVCGTFDKWGTIKCTSHIVREKKLEEIILNDLNKIINSKDSIKNEVKIGIKKEINKLNKDILSINSKIESLKTRKLNALEKLVDSIITKEDYDFIIDSMNINELEEQLLIKSQLLKSLSTKDNVQEIYNLIGDSKINELNKEILNKTVREIKVKEDGSPVIYYNFQNPFK